MRGGQVSIEYLFVTAFSFLLLVPLVILFFTQSTAIEADINEAQAKSVGRELTQSAERVYYSGPPTRETVKVIFPEKVSQTEVINNSIIFTIQGVASQQYELLIPSDVPLVPVNLSSVQGPAKIIVEATSSGVTLTAQ